MVQRAVTIGKRDNGESVNERHTSLRKHFRCDDAQNFRRYCSSFPYWRLIFIRLCVWGNEERTRKIERVPNGTKEKFRWRWCFIMWNFFIVISRCAKNMLGGCSDGLEIFILQWCIKFKCHFISCVTFPALFSLSEYENQSFILLFPTSRMSPSIFH